MRKRISVNFALILILALAMFMAVDTPVTGVAEAGLYDILNPQLIELYETEIAGEKIISSKSASQLQRSADRYSVSVQKMKCMILLQDFSARMGKSIGMNSLAEMSDFNLLSYAKGLIDEYAKTLDPEEKSRLEGLIKDALKNK